VGEQRQTVADLRAEAELMLCQLMAEEDGLEEEVIQEWLAKAGDKAQALRVIRQVRVDREESYLREVDRFQRRADREAKGLEYLTELAHVLLEGHRKLTGEPRINTPDGSHIRIQRTTSYRVEVLDETAVPERFIRTKRTVDKAALQPLLKSGEVVAGVELVEAVSEGARWGK